MISVLKARLASAPDTEDAVIRLVIIAAILLYYTVFVAPENGWSQDEVRVASGVFGFFVIAIGIFISICLRPQKMIWRRIVGMLSDNGGATFYVWVAGENGALMIFVYLFVAFGYGARYGTKYLRASAVLSCIGFALAIFMVPFWQQHRAMGFELLVALAVLPACVNKFLMQITARAKRLQHEVTELRAKLASVDGARE